MKRLVLVGFLLLGSGILSYGQTDDIYATGRDQRGSQPADNHASNQHGPESGDMDNYQSYNNPDDYIDYEDDSYSSRINRFDNSFYNMGYYSTFYNPWWYNRYWVDPYWGYNPWTPGISISFGIGPFWYGGWGWNTWYGYPGFYSAWGYPYYAGGWYGGCYGGYWNRYYAGYESGHYYRNGYGAYGPRQVYSMGNRVGNRLGSNGFRTSQVSQIGLRNTPLAAAGAGYKTNATGMGMRGGSNISGNQVNQRGANNTQGQRFGGSNNSGGRNFGAQQNSSGRGGFRSIFGGGNRSSSPSSNRSFGAPSRSGGFGNGARPGGFGGGNRSGGFGGGGGSRSSGGGGGRSSGGGGGSRSSGGSHSGGRR